MKIVRRFLFTGSPETLTIPVGVDSFDFYVFGGNGGGWQQTGASSELNDGTGAGSVEAGSQIGGGLGNLETGTISLVGSATREITVVVGGGGGRQSGDRTGGTPRQDTDAAFGGWPDGGAGGGDQVKSLDKYSARSGGGGGGSSSLWLGELIDNHPLVVSGGGGGAGANWDDHRAGEPTAPTVAPRTILDPAIYQSVVDATITVWQRNKLAYGFGVGGNAMPARPLAAYTGSIPVTGPGYATPFNSIVGYGGGTGASDAYATASRNAQPASAVANGLPGKTPQPVQNAGYNYDGGIGFVLPDGYGGNHLTNQMIIAATPRAQKEPQGQSSGGHGQQGGYYTSGTSNAFGVSGGGGGGGGGYYGGGGGGQGFNALNPSATALMPGVGGGGGGGGSFASTDVVPLVRPGGDYYFNTATDSVINPSGDANGRAFIVYEIKPAKPIIGGTEIIQVSLRDKIKIRFSWVRFGMALRQVQLQSRVQAAAGDSPVAFTNSISFPRSQAVDLGEDPSYSPTTNSTSNPSDDVSNYSNSGDPSWPHIYELTLPDNYFVGPNNYEIQLVLTDTDGESSTSDFVPVIVTLPGDPVVITVPVTDVGTETFTVTWDYPQSASAHTFSVKAELLDPAGSKVLWEKDNVHNYRTNFVPNPAFYFASATTPGNPFPSWTLTRPGGTTLTQLFDNGITMMPTSFVSGHRTRTSYCHIAWGSDPAGTHDNLETYVYTKPGATYTFSYDVRKIATSSDFYPMAYARSLYSPLISVATPDLAFGSAVHVRATGDLSGEWERISISFVATTGLSIVGFAQPNPAGVSGQIKTNDIANVMVEMGAGRGVYYDGFSPGAFWLGAADQQAPLTSQAALKGTTYTNFWADPVFTEPSTFTKTSANSWYWLKQKPGAALTQSTAQSFSGAGSSAFVLGSTDLQPTYLDINAKVSAPNGDLPYIVMSAHVYVPAGSPDVYLADDQGIVTAATALPNARTSVKNQIVRLWTVVPRTSEGLFNTTQTLRVATVPSGTARGQFYVVQAQIEETQDNDVPGPSRILLTGDYGIWLDVPNQSALYLYHEHQANSVVIDLTGLGSQPYPVKISVTYNDTSTFITDSVPGASVINYIIDPPDVIGSAEALSELCAVRLSVTDLNPDGDNVALSAEIYRQNLDDGSPEVLIGDVLIPNTEFIDYRPQAKTNYNYRIRVYSTKGYKDVN